MYRSNGREKNPADRVRRNAETYVIDNPISDGRLHGPRLPKHRDWCEETLNWWQVWRRSDQAMLMTTTDWSFMLDTAVLHNMLWSGQSQNGRGNGAVSDVQLAAEIRQRVGKFGATYEDRKKLRMAVDCPQTRFDSDLASEGEEDDIDAEAARLADKYSGK